MYLNAFGQILNKEGKDYLIRVSVETGSVELAQKVENPDFLNMTSRKRTSDQPITCSQCSNLYRWNRKKNSYLFV